MPRLFRMNFRMAKWLNGRLGIAPATASAAGARAGTGSTTGLANEFTKKAIPANRNREPSAFSILKIQLLQGGHPREMSQPPTYFLIDGCPVSRVMPTEVRKGGHIEGPGRRWVRFLELRTSILVPC